MALYLPIIPMAVSSIRLVAQPQSQVSYNLINILIIVCMGLVWIRGTICLCVSVTESLIVHLVLSSSSTGYELSLSARLISSGVGSLVDRSLRTP